MLKTLHKSSALLGTGQRMHWALLALLALIASGFEAAGALIVFGLLTVITSEASGYDVPVVGDLRERFPDAGETTLVVVIGVVICAFFVLRAVVLVLKAYVQGRLAENAGARLAAGLLDGYLAMPYSFHLQRNSAELIRNTYDTVQQYVQDALTPAVRLLTSSLITAGLLAVLVITSPWATLLAIAVLGPFTFVLLRVLHPRVKRFGVEAQRRSKMNLQTLEEALAGWRDIKILGREDAFVEQFERDRLRLARARYLRATTRELPRIALETGTVLFILGFLGISVIVQGGALEALPVLGLFGYVAVRLQPYLNDILVSLNALKFIGPGVDLLYHDLQLFASGRRARGTQPAEPLPLRSEIRLRDVSIRYPNAHRDALTSVSATIHAGEFVGIVGPTGGGKSTLVDVILGLLEPTRGTVEIDGAPLSGHAAAWHANLGVVHQTVFLADTSIRRNVALGTPDGEIDEERMAEAIEVAQLSDFISSLPDGLDAVVGQRGVRLSGGQRQRLAIARAVYRQPGVLVLDEGTSALDHNTEAALMTAVQPDRGDRTVIVVTHRLGTVAGADRILLVEDGRLVATGLYDDLAARYGDLLTARA